MQPGVESTPSLIVFLGLLLALAILSALSGDAQPGKGRAGFDGCMALWIGVLALCFAGLLEAGEHISAAFFVAACRLTIVATILASLILWARSESDAGKDESEPHADSSEPVA